MSWFAGTEYQRIADAIAQLAEDTRKPPLILSLCEWGVVSRVLVLALSQCSLDTTRNNPGYGQGDSVKAGW